MSVKSMLDVPKSVGGISLNEIAMAGGAKVITERLAAPYIGDGTFKSGIAKGLVAALVVPKLLGNSEISRAVSIGMGVDAFEDFATALMTGGFDLSGLLGGGQANTINGEVV